MALALASRSIWEFGLLLEKLLERCAPCDGRYSDGMLADMSTAIAIDSSVWLLLPFFPELFKTSASDDGYASGPADKCGSALQGYIHKGKLGQEMFSLMFVIHL